MAGGRLVEDGLVAADRLDQSKERRIELDDTAASSPASDAACVRRAVSWTASQPRRSGSATSPSSRLEQGGGIVRERGRRPELLHGRPAPSGRPGRSSRRRDPATCWSRRRQRSR